MSLRLAFGPWTDGVFLTENAQDLLAKGKYTKVSGPTSSSVVTDMK
jgi:hypothetical protein